MLTSDQAQTILDQDKDRQAKYYSVIVDGNAHHLPESIRTTKEQITLKKCQNITTKLQEKYQIDIRRIEIMMSEFDFSHVANGDEYLNVLYNDCGLALVIDKTAYYWPKLNRLQIWENGTPVYENDNGVICRDLDALADCLM